MVDIENPGRGRGIFSEADREYLKDPENYKSRQARHKRREEIPPRIENGILDFSILADPEFPEERLNEAFSASEDEAEELDGPWAHAVQTGQIDGPLSDPDVEDSVVDAVAFFHRMYPPSLFNDIIEEGVERAVERYYPGVEVVDASYNPDIRDKETAHEVAKKKLEAGTPLTGKETKLLIEVSEVDVDRVVENIRNQPEDSGDGDSDISVEDLLNSSPLE